MQNLNKKEKIFYTKNKNCIKSYLRLENFLNFKEI